MSTSPTGDNNIKRLAPLLFGMPGVVLLVAHGRNGLRVLQVISPATVPGATGSVRARIRN